MVNLLVGPKGTGKTQTLIDLANKDSKAREGNVVFIKKTHKETYSLCFAIRAICMKDFPAITNTDAYIGFLYGLYSANSDIESVFIDNITKIADINDDNVPAFIERLKKISEETGIEFFVSISVDKEKLKDINLDGAKFLDYEVAC
jgi:hypothetical protein